MRKSAYGLNRMIESPTEPPYRSVLPLQQPVTYPGNSDYDAPDTVMINHEKRMPHHEGDLEIDADFGFNITELVEGRETQPLSQADLWGQSYNDDFGAHYGQAAPQGPPAPQPEDATAAVWVAVDLDGTILESVPWPEDYDPTSGVQPPLGQPIPGSVDVLVELARLGWRISIYTARFGDETLPPETVQAWAKEIAEHLQSNGVPFSDIWVGRKPRADYFVDDKAIQFDGDWAAILEQLTLIDAPPRDPDATEGAVRGPLDYPEDPNAYVGLDDGAARGTWR